MSDAPSLRVLTEIGAERERQKTVEGWTPEHDDEHSDGAMADAAACYAAGSCVSALRGAEDARFMNIWPSAWTFKARGRRSNLIRAAALIVAEIERLDRAQASQSNRKDGSSLNSNPTEGEDS